MFEDLPCLFKPSKFQKHKRWQDSEITCMTLLWQMFRFFSLFTFNYTQIIHRCWQNSLGLLPPSLLTDVITTHENTIKLVLMLAIKIKVTINTDTDATPRFRYNSAWITWNIIFIQCTRTISMFSERLR